MIDDFKRVTFRVKTLEETLPDLQNIFICFKLVFVEHPSYLKRQIKKRQKIREKNNQKFHVLKKRGFLEIVSLSSVSFQKIQAGQLSPTRSISMKHYMGFIKSHKSVR